MFKFLKNQTQRMSAALAIMASILMLVLLAGCADPRFKHVLQDLTHKQDKADSGGGIAGSMKDYCRKTGRC